MIAPVFAADLPPVAVSPRAELLQRELDGMRRLSALLADELEASARELARLDPENPRVNAARRVVALARIG